MATSPLSRSKALLQDEGYLVAIVEHWNAFARIRQDLFGFLDLLAIRENEIVGIQVTSASNVAARVKKISTHENIAMVRKSGIGVFVHGWGKNKSGKWICRVVDLS